MVKSKKLKVYRHFESMNNLQAVESAKRNFIHPDVLGIPNNRWIASLSAHIDKQTIEAYISLLRELKYNHIYKNNNSIVLSFLPQKN